LELVGREPHSIPQKESRFKWMASLQALIFVASKVVGLEGNMKK
jgi:hypothetical protein